VFITTKDNKVRVIYIPYGHLASGKSEVDFQVIGLVMAKFQGIRLASAEGWFRVEIGFYGINL